VLVAAEQPLSESDDGVAVRKTAEKRVDLTSFKSFE
jgi:hypothetical protein